MNEKNIQIGVFAALGGLVISLALNIIFYKDVYSLLFRPLEIGALWFVITALIFHACEQFLPEFYKILSGKEKSPSDEKKTKTPLKGKNLDIRMDDEEIGNISLTKPDELAKDTSSNLFDLEKKIPTDTPGMDQANSLKYTGSMSGTSLSGKKEKYKFPQDTKTLAKAVRTVMKKQ